MSFFIQNSWHFDVWIIITRNAFHYDSSALRETEKECNASMEKKTWTTIVPYLLANVSGLSSLNELPAAVPTDEIVEHEKGLHCCKLNM
jgi:hypothetical protein